MVKLLFLSFLLLVSKDATAILSLIQPPFASLQVNSNSGLLPNRTLKPAPEAPFKLVNRHVQPPITVEIVGYGAPISRAIADVCLYKALHHALDTHDHTSLAPIHASNLDYSSANVSLSFRPVGLVTWDEWKNALYLMLKLVDEFDTRGFSFAVEIRKQKKDWYVVGQGYLIAF